MKPIYNKSSCLQLVMIVLLCSTQVHAATREIDPHAVHEQEKINEIVDVAREAMIGAKNFSDETRTSCMNSFGHAQFCDCLGRELPVTQSFDSYIFFMTTPRDELNYARLKPDDKELVDSAYRTRETCVKESTN